MSELVTKTQQNQKNEPITDKTDINQPLNTNKNANNKHKKNGVTSQNNSNNTTKKKQTPTKDTIKHEPTKYKPPTKDQIILGLNDKHINKNYKINYFEDINILKLYNNDWYTKMKFIKKPPKDDWLEMKKPEERKGQTFKQFTHRKQVRYPTIKAHNIGLIEIGPFELFNLDYYGKEISFSNAMKLIVETFYTLPVKLITPKTSIPELIEKNEIISFECAKGLDNIQLLIKNGKNGIIDKVIKPTKLNNKDLYILMGYTLYDLKKMNFGWVSGVGISSLGVGIFSFARKHTRKDRLYKTKQQQLKFFLKSWKTLLHEIGHLFGIRHCIWFHCLMNGSTSSLGNHDKKKYGQKPNHLCVACLQKIHYSTVKSFGKEQENDIACGEMVLDILQRYKQIVYVLTGFGYVKEAKWYGNIVQYMIKRKCEKYGILLGYWFRKYEIKDEECRKNVYDGVCRCLT